MAIRRSFKSDESFLEKIAIGAVGTRRVFHDMESQGHQPLELERGSTSFKIWKTIKIKRIRVPDILCVSCGRRVESRAKTNLKMSMSHSTSDPDRSWDHGLENEDFIAFVVCRKDGDLPIDWKADELVQYISVRDMRKAQEENKSVLVKPKGAEEGFEARIDWPSAVSNSNGIVIQITPSRIQYKRFDNNRLITIRLERNNQDFLLNPLVDIGSNIYENQFIASVVPVYRSFECMQTTSEYYYIEQLSNRNISKRYAAAKALSLFRSDIVSNALTNTVNNGDEHIYVRLEAAASLVKQDDPKGLFFIEERLLDDFPQYRLEAVIVLSEVVTEDANQLLVKTLLDNNQHPEVRAGAAWALGEKRSQSSIDALIKSFIAVDNNIRNEAARALAKLARTFSADIIKKLPESSTTERPGIAWALSRSDQFSISDLYSSLVDDDARHWISYILGSQGQTRFLNEIESLRTVDPEVYFAVTVLWKIMASWVYRLEEY